MLEPANFGIFAAGRTTAVGASGRFERRNEKSYRKATQEAKALGVFGSPTFVVGREVFWGDDRLEDAIRWSKSPVH